MENIQLELDNLRKAADRQAARKHQLKEQIAAAKEKSSKPVKEQEREMAAKKERKVCCLIFIETRR